MSVMNLSAAEKPSETLRFSRLPQEAATELHRSPVVVRWNAMDPPTISIHCAAPPPTNTRTRVARSPHVDRAFPSSWALGSSRLRSWTDAYHVFRSWGASPTRSSRAILSRKGEDEARHWRPAIKANLLNTQSLWVALIALVYSLFLRHSIVGKYYNTSILIYNE